MEGEKRGEEGTKHRYGKVLKWRSGEGNRWSTILTEPEKETSWRGAIRAVGNCTCGRIETDMYISCEYASASRVGS